MKLFLFSILFIQIIFSSRLYTSPFPLSNTSCNFTYPCSLRNGIFHSETNDEIYLLNGVYSNEGDLIIDHSLIVLGEMKTNVIIEGDIRFIIQSSDIDTKIIFENFSIRNVIGNPLIKNDWNNNGRNVILKNMIIDHPQRMVLHHKSTTIHTNVTIENCLFEKYDFNESMIFIEYGKNVLIKNTEFKEIKSGEIAGVYLHRIQDMIEIKDSRFLSNQAEKYGGAVRSTYYNMFLIKNTTFFNNSVINGNENGGALYVYGSPGEFCKDLTIEDSLFDSNNVKWNGGAIYGKYLNYVKIKNSVITNNVADHYGGGMFFQYFDDVKLEDTQMIKNHASAGGAITVWRNDLVIHGNISLYDCLLKENTGGALYTAETKKVHIENTDFISNVNVGNGGGIVSRLFDKFDLILCDFYNNTSYDNGGGLYIGVSTYVRGFLDIDRCNFIQNNASLDSGGAMRVGHLNKTMIRDSLFHDNFANDGGALYVRSCIEFITTGCTYTNNKAIDDSGAITSFFNEYPSFINSTFRNNEADCLRTEGADGYGGAIKVSDFIKGEAVDLEFHQNYATKGSSMNVVYFEEFYGYNIEIIDSRSEGLFFYAKDGGYFELKNSKIANNMNGGFFVIRTDEVYLEQLVVQNNTNFHHNYDGLMYFEMDYKTDESNFAIRKGITITDSLFISNRARNGGCILLKHINKFNVSNTEFLNNEAYVGGAIYAEGLLQNLYFTGKHSTFSGFGNMVTNCTFNGNKATKYGGSIYARGMDNYISVENSKFYNGYSLKGADMYIRSTTRGSVKNCDFYYSSSPVSSIYQLYASVDLISLTFNHISGTGIFAQGGKLDVRNTEFFNCSAGAIVGKELTLYSYLYELLIEECVAENGGAIRLESIDEYVEFNMWKVTAKQNKATKGGAIYLKDNTCKFQFDDIAVENNVAKYGGGLGIENTPNLFIIPSVFFFNQNTAQIAGGAAFDFSGDANFPSYPNLIVSGNTALLYGDDFASKPKEIRLKMITTGKNQSFTDINSTIYVYPNQHFDLFVEVYDDYENVMKYYPTSNLEISIDSELSKLQVINKELKIDNEEIHFTMLSILKHKDDPENINLIVKCDDVFDSLYIPIKIINCLPGSKLQQDGDFKICIECPVGFYSILNNSNDCHSCPDNAKCITNYEVNSKANYWVTNNYVVGIAEVYACEGNICLEDNKCLTGRDHTKPLCSACLPGLSMWNGACLLCEGISVVFLLLYLLYYLIIFIKEHIEHQAALGFSAISKIYFFFSQTMTLILSDLHLFSFFKSLFAFQMYSPKTTDITQPSTNCPFPRDSYFRIISNICQPLIFIGVIVVCIVIVSIFKGFETCFEKKKGKKEKKKQPEKDIELKEQVEEQSEKLLVEKVDLKDTIQQKIEKETKDDDIVISIEKEKTVKSDDDVKQDEEKKEPKIAVEEEDQKTKEESVKDDDGGKKKKKKLLPMMKDYLKLGLKWVYQYFFSLDAYALSFFAFLILIYQPFTIQTFHFFACKKFGLDFYVKTASDIKCFSDKWFDYFGLFLPLLMYSVLFPFIVLLFLIIFKKFLYKPKFRRLFGTLYVSYREGCDVWYECYSLLRRSSLIFCIVLFNTLFFIPESVVNIIVSILLFFMYIFQRLVQPYRTKQENHLEEAGLLALFVVQLFKSSLMFTQFTTFSKVCLIIIVVPAFFYLTFFYFKIIFLTVWSKVKSVLNCMKIKCCVKFMDRLSKWVLRMINKVRDQLTPIDDIHITIDVDISEFSMDLLEHLNENVKKYDRKEEITNIDDYPYEKRIEKGFEKLDIFVYSKENLNDVDKRLLFIIVKWVIEKEEKMKFL